MGWLSGRYRFFLLAIGLGAAVLVLLVATRGKESAQPDSPQVVVEKVVRSYDAAIANSDVQGLISLTTDTYFAAHFGDPEQLEANSEQFDSPLGKLTDRQVDTVTIEGDQATVFSDLRGFKARNIDADETRLVLREGKWLVDYTAPRITQPSANATLIDMQLKDFSFGYTPEDFKQDTPFVIRATNVGAQAHMAAIWRIPDDAILIKLVEATDGLPEGSERVVNSQVFQPGETGDITVDKGLQPGRYMLVCFLNDNNDVRTPHYDRGMITEFRVN